MIEVGKSQPAAWRRAQTEEDLVACRDRLYRVALLMLGSREDAEDATQKALLRALEAWQGFRKGSGLYTWLYRILVNVCKDRRRARARAMRWLEEGHEKVEAVAAAGPGSLELLERRERDEQVRAALLALEPEQRRILVLRHYEELSYQQIAEVLECPLGTVRSRLFGARERLRHELARGRSARPATGGP